MYYMFVKNNSETNCYNPATKVLFRSGSGVFRDAISLHSVIDTNSYDLFLFTFT